MWRHYPITHHRATHSVNVLLLHLKCSVATAKSGNNRGGTDRSQLAGAKGRPAAMRTVPFLATEMLSHFAALMGTLDPLHDTPSHSPPPSSPHCLCCRCTSWMTDAMKRRVTKALSAASEREQRLTPLAFTHSLMNWPHRRRRLRQQIAYNSLLRRVFGRTR